VLRLQGDDNDFVHRVSRCPPVLRRMRSAGDVVTFRPHTGLYGQRWDLINGDGHYAIRFDHSDPRETKFTALFVPGLWANAEEIGVRKTQADAETLCGKHAAKALTIKAIKNLATGVN
jgi:hypothetical protein